LKNGMYLIGSGISVVSGGFYGSAREGKGGKEKGTGVVFGFGFTGHDEGMRLGLITSYHALGQFAVTREQKGFWYVIEGRRIQGRT